MASGVRGTIQGEKIQGNMLVQYIFWVDQTGFISPPNQNSDSTSLKAVYSSCGCRCVNFPFAYQHLLFSIKSLNLEIYMRKFTLPFRLYQNSKHRKNIHQIKTQPHFKLSQMTFVQHYSRFVEEKVRLKPLKGKSNTYVCFRSSQAFIFT